LRQRDRGRRHIGKWHVDQADSVHITSLTLLVVSALWTLPKMPQDVAVLERR
jgi:hypothetical protein